MTDGDTKIVHVKWSDGYHGKSTLAPDEDEFEEMQHMNTHSDEDDYTGDVPAGYAAPFESE